MNHRKRNPISSLLQVTALAFSLTVGLSACGSEEGGAKATQVAAKVGSSEISVHQINQVLSRTPMGNASKDAVQAASQQVLERLIDQQLAVDQATESKLHRSPDVVAQLEAARREVLARAYLQQLTSSVPKPTPEEIKKYYQDNPALFAERRVFNLQEIRVPNAIGIVDDLKKMADQGRPIEEVAGLLRTRNVQFGGGSATRTAEQLPLELLPQVHALKDGQSIAVQTGDSVTFVRVASSQQVPVSEATATPGIAQFLNNRRSAETVGSEIKRLRDVTTITYLGDFDRAATKGVAPTDKPATPAEALPLAVPVESGGKPAGSADQSAMERGIQGLK
jgi:EpsD family peptidyl-prolyl cis-trans isomerase